MELSPQDTGGMAVIVLCGRDATRDTAVSGFSVVAGPAFAGFSLIFMRQKRTKTAISM